MPSLGELREFASWIFDAYGAVSSILIFAIMFLVWQLRAEQKENREAKTAQLRIMERAGEVQLSFVKSLNDLKVALSELKMTVERLGGNSK